MLGHFALKWKRGVWTDPKRADCEALNAAAGPSQSGYHLVRTSVISPKTTNAVAERISPAIASGFPHSAWLSIGQMFRFRRGSEARADWRLARAGWRLNPRQREIRVDLSTRVLLDWIALPRRRHLRRNRSGIKVAMT
jgi:hypothetical protein